MGDPAFPDGDGFLDGMRAVLMALPGIGVLFDREGRLVWGNDAFAARYGAQGDDIASHMTAEIAQDLMAPDQLNHATLTFASGRTARYSCSCIGGEAGFAPFLLLQEVENSTVSPTSAFVHQGLIQSREERDRARAAERRMREEVARWRRLSMTDRLTGLHNASGFHEAAEAMLRDHEGAALVYADLNGFKMINDTLGHSAGDGLLRDIGQRIMAAIRSSDLAGRMGGDEFAILLPGCPPEELDKVTTRLRSAMQRRFPVERDGDQPTLILAVDAAIGAAMFPNEGATLDELLRLADARMFDDKHRSKYSRRPA